MNLLLRWLVSAGALGVTIYVLQLLELGRWTGGRGADAVLIALVTVLVMGIVNAVIRPAVKLLALPLTCATLGLFSFLVNGLMFYVVGEVITGAFDVGFWGAVLGAIVMSVVGGIANLVIIAPRERGA